MIFLWNKERILIEGLELAQLKISSELGFDKNVVEAEYIEKDGKLFPDFKIDKSLIPIKYLDGIDSVIKGVWVEVERITNEKLENIDD